jgi:BMFP domain-containing protein YqiC
MDAELRKEVRAEKAETKDRLDRLEARMDALEATQNVANDVTAPDGGKGKKAASDPSEGESA